MKYFCRYLPVEGEIKKGDWAFYNNILHQVQYDNNNLIGWKKVKLFLCSRDIQVGDKVRCKFSTSTEEFTGEVESIMEWGGAYVINPDESQGFLGKPCPLLKETYKVIGEISPDATWVKEGDEFEVEDIAYEDYRGATHNLKDLLIDFKDDLQHLPEGPWLLRGPCGHFH